MEKILRITGKGTVRIKPDLTIINLMFENTFDYYDDAFKRSCSDVSNIKNILVKLGLEKESLKTTLFEIKPRYESIKDKDGNYVSKFLGYSYKQRLLFKYKSNNELLGKILYEISNVDTNPKFDILYGISDIEDIKNKALENAIKDAIKKANIISLASGVKLGDILNIDYQTSRRYDDDYYEDSVLDCSCNTSSRTMNIDIEPEDKEINDIVNITYQIL